MCDDTPNPCKKNDIKSVKEGIDRRDRFIAKKPRIKKLAVSEKRIMYRSSIESSRGHRCRC